MHIGFEARQNMPIAGVADARLQVHVHRRRSARGGIFRLEIRHFDFQPVGAGKHGCIGAHVAQPGVRVKLLHRQVL